VAVQAEYNFFLAMTLHPEAQRMAQAELDRVIGTDRLPCLADRVNLPYTDALVKEVFRWHPIVPQGQLYMISLMLRAE
jgi:cytochrome P450